MRTGYTKLTTIALGCAATIAIAMGAFSRTTTAWNPQPDPPRVMFSMIGITRGQTARMSVSNVGLPPGSTTPPPCRAIFGFVDANGDVLVNAAGQPVRRAVMLDAGHSASLQINGDEFAGLVTNVDAIDAAPRPNVRRAMIQRQLQGEVPPPCIPSLEVIDNASGLTLFVNAGVVGAFGSTEIIQPSSSSSGQ